MQKRLVLDIKIIGFVVLILFKFCVSQKILLDTSCTIDALPAAILKVADEAYYANIKGLDALEKNELDTAVMLFSKAVSLFPGYTDARNNIGVVHFKKGNISQASMIWKEITEKEPGYSVAYHNLGIVEFHKGNYESARKYFQKAVDINKKFIESLLMLGRAEINLKMKKEALEHFKTANKIAPQRIETSQFLAYGYINIGDTTSAISILSKYKDNASCLKMLGEIEVSRKNYQDAASYFSLAIEKGENADQMLELASVLIDAGNCKEALDVIKKYSTKVSVWDADAYLFAGIASKECGNINAAKEYFEKGVSLYPKDAILRYNLGVVYFNLKQFSLAETTWSMFGDTISDPSIYYLRALNAKKNENFELAENYIRSALRRDERAEYFDLLGVILYKKGQKEEAVSCFKKALKISPDYRSAQLNLALVTQDKEELERAITEAEKSKQNCHSRCQDISFELSVLYYQSGQLQKAVSVLESMPDGEKTEKIFRHIALFYREMHEWDKAIKALENAKKFFVLELQTEYELAETYLFSGNYQKAIESLNSLLEKWDKNPWRIYYQLGYAYMEIKDFQKAKKYLEISLKKKSDNLAAQGLMAYIYNLEGNSEQARVLWEKTLKEDPNNFVLLVNMGLSYEKEGNYDVALDYYKKAQMIKTEDKGILINLGNIYSMLNKIPEAIQCYTEALNSNKRDIAAYNLYILAKKINNKSKALEMIAILEKEFPKSDYTKRIQAEIYLEKKDTANALALIEPISIKDGGDWIFLAKIYASQKNFYKANQCLDNLPKEFFWETAKNGVKAQIEFIRGNYKEAFTIWKSMKDTSFAVLFNMALAAFNGKDYKQAINIGESISFKAKGDDRADILRLVGNSYMALKEWKKALQWYNQLEDLRKDEPIVLFNIAVIHYNLGNINESWDYYQKARKINPSLENKDIENRYKYSKGEISKDGLLLIDSIDTWYNDAVSLQDSGKDTLAEVIYKKILDRKPNYYRAWNNLGAIYSARGQLDSAENCYLKSIEKIHDIPEAYANLVNIYLAMENYKEAQRWLVKGIGHNPDSEILKELEKKVKELSKKKK